MPVTRHMVRQPWVSIPTAAAGGPWTPASITGLLAWHDASDAGSITSSGGAVSQWNDKSTNGYHLTQGTGTNQPTTGTLTQNGLNVVDFDGSNDYMVSSSSLYTYPTSTFFAVVKLDTASGVQQLCDGKSAGTRHTILTVSNTWRIYQGVSIVDSGIATSTSVAQITGTFTGGSTTVLRVNGSSGTSGDAGNGNAIDLGVGCDTTSGTAQFLDGYICEMIRYSGNLSTTDRDTVEAYLKAKWGTP